MKPDTQFAKPSSATRSFALLGTLAVLVSTSLPSEVAWAADPTGTEPANRGFREFVGLDDSLIDSNSAAYVRGEAIVRYRSVDAVPFGRASNGLPIASGSTSLDQLHERYAVQEATELFRATPRRPGAASGSANRLAADAAHTLSDVYRLRVPVDTNLVQMCDEFESEPSVAYCHPNYRVETYHNPTDRYFGTSGAWGQSYPDLWGLELVRAHDAWHEIGATGSPVIVAVVDTGVDYAHPDIRDNIWRNAGELTSAGVYVPGDLNADGCPGVCGVDDDADGLIDEDSAGCGAEGHDALGNACTRRDDLAADDDENGFPDDHIGWDFRSNDNDPIDDVGHGTHVAGTIGAMLDNGLGIAGVAPDAEIMIVKGLGTAGGTAAGLAAALRYAVDSGADVINNSWGNTFPTAAPDVLIDAVRYATANGVVVVSAAGNSATELGGLPRGFAPASIPDSIAISAFDHLDRLSDFSNFGIGIDVSGPGGDSQDDTAGTSFEYLNILSLRAAGLFEDSPFRVDDDYLRFRGTSMSSPHAAGVAALIRSAFPQYGVEEVRQALRRGAADVGQPGWDLDGGDGRVDAYASVRFETPSSALIRRPATREILSGSVEIHGVAAGNEAIGGSNFAGYRLEFAPGDLPADTDWIVIATSQTPVGHSDSDSLLAIWEIPATLADGEYTLRLVVSDDQNREFESRIGVEIDQFDPPEMTGWPQLPSRGTDQLIPLMPNVADLDRDGDLEILLGPFAWQHDGTAIVHHPFGFFTNYPFPLSILQGIHGQPSVGDIDDDGENEVVLIHHDAIAGDAAIHVFGADGEPKPGWPKPLLYEGAIGRTATPVLADIDGDDVLDVITLDTDTAFKAKCRIDVYRGDGSAIFSRSLGGACTTIPTVADLDGDGGPEIFVVRSDGHIVALDSGGELAPVWPQNFRVDDQFDYIGPSVGDLDGDGELDLVLPSFDGRVYAFSGDGRPIPGWPIDVACCDPSLPALADLDRDGRLDVLIGDRDGNVHVFDHHGSAREGWPIRVDGAANTTPAVADIDGDGFPDIVAVTGDRKIHAWNSDGREIAEQGWPITTGEYAGDSPFQDLLGLAAAPIVTDLDLDGDREVVAFTRNVHVWDLPDAASALSREWKMYRASPRSPGTAHEDQGSDAPTAPRIYASPEFATVADIEDFTLSFDLFSPGAPVAEASWWLVDLDAPPGDPEQKGLMGQVDGSEVDLSSPQPLPEQAGLFSRSVRIQTPGRYQIQAVLRTEPNADTGEADQDHFVGEALVVLEILPANPVGQMVPGSTVSVRTVMAAQVHFDIVPGLRRFDYRVVHREDPDAPVWGTIDNDLDLGDRTPPGDRDLSDPAFIGLFIDPKSPVDAMFAVDDPGDYDVEISILAFDRTLGRTIEIGATQLHFTATPLADSDSDGWVDAQDNCTSVVNGIGQAPTNACSDPPCVGNQIDTDGDGFGNACDGDLDGDGQVTGNLAEDCSTSSSDWCLFAAAFGRAAGEPGYVPDADCNGDDRIDTTDENCLVRQLGGPPGPSGLGCAGVPVCIEPSGDADNDGIMNRDDVCMLVTDVTALDTDSDGFGDRCDADYDNDGTVRFRDFALIAAAFGTTDPLFDHDGDGIVGFADITTFIASFGHPPGPSGLNPPPPN